MSTALESLATVSERVRQLVKRDDTESRDERDKLSDAVRDLATRLPHGRRAEFHIGDVDGAGDFGDVLAEAGERGGPAAQVRALDTTPSNRDEVIEAQVALDDLKTLRALLKRDPTRTKYFQRKRAELPLLRKLLDTTDNSAIIPADFSASMVAAVRLQLRVAALFPRVQMPTSTFTLPLEGQDGEAYHWAENGGTDDDLDDQKRVPPSVPTFGAATLRAKKLMARYVVSSELTEDSAVAMLPHLRTSLSRVMARAEETVAINASTAMPHPDSDVTTTYDQRTICDRLRSVATRSTMGNNQCVFSAATAGRIELADLRKLRQLMGKFALYPGDAAIVAGPLGYTQLLGITDSNGNPLTVTVDKYGDRATLLSGEVGRIDGWPIVLSEFVSEGLNRFGFVDGITTDSTLVILCNRTSFTWGDHGSPRLSTRDLPETDQLALVTRQRLDFLAYRPTTTCVGLIRGVRSA